MNIVERLRKYFTRGQSDTQPTVEDAVINRPSNLPAQPWNKAKEWVNTNKRQSILIGVLLVLVLASGTYALLKGADHAQPKPATEATSELQNGSTDALVENNGAVPENNGASGAPGTTSAGTSNGTGGTSTTSAEVIGFVGCSNIRDTVQGYQANGGNNFWVPVDNTYAGGTVTKWGNLSSEYWAQFDQFLAKYPTTKTIWWGLCTYSSDRESNSSNNSAAKAVLAELRKKIPGVTIYVSAINDFVAPHVCRLTGQDGPSRMRALANTIVSAEGLKAGPSLDAIIYYNTDPSTYDPTSGYYTNSNGATAANNQTKPDGCHPNDAGEIYLGKSLINFFGS